MTASSQPTSPAGISINWRSDVAVVVCLAVALVAGWFFKGAVQGQRQTIEDPLTGLRLSVPVTWQADQDVPNVILAASDGHSASTFKTKLTVVSRQIDASATLDAGQIVERVMKQHKSKLHGYHMLAIEPASDVAANPAK